MSLSQKLVSDLTYAEIIIGIVVSLILVAFWQRALENSMFETFGINRKSTYQTTVIAIVATVIFFVFINMVESLARDAILGVGEEGVTGTQSGAPFASAPGTTQPSTTQPDTAKTGGENERCKGCDHVQTLFRYRTYTIGRREQLSSSERRSEGTREHD